MRDNTSLAALSILALFALSVLVGYVGGNRYLHRQPRAATTPQTAAVEPAPPLAPPAAPGLRTPRMPSQPPEALPSPPAATPTPASTPSGAEPPATASPAPRAIPAPTLSPQVSPHQTPVPPGGDGERLHRVQVGAFTSREHADELVAKLKADGFSPYLVLEGSVFKVRAGAFRNRALADELAGRLRAKGYPVTITR